MKVVSLKEKSLFDIARNIASILNGGVPKTTDDKNGFIGAVSAFLLFPYRSSLL